MSAQWRHKSGMYWDEDWKYETILDPSVKVQDQIPSVILWKHKHMFLMVQVHGFQPMHGRDVSKIIINTGLTTSGSTGPTPQILSKIPTS